jgi:hypothetical protein
LPLDNLINFIGRSVRNNSVIVHFENERKSAHLVGKRNQKLKNNKQTQKSDLKSQDKP